METFFVYGLVFLFFIFILLLVLFVVLPHTDRDAASPATQGTGAKTAAKKFTMTDERVAYGILALFFLFIIIITIMEEKKRSERAKESEERTRKPSPTALRKSVRGKTSVATN
jgi:preprotein translocase subunit SecG